MAATTTYLPAAIGDDVSQIDTPALCVSLDRLETNMARMKSYLAAHPHIRFRPHFKAHKASALARLQLDTHGGPQTMCCQKLCEAQALVNAGVTDILLTNEVVGAAKLKRLGGLLKQGADIAVLADCRRNLDDLARLARDIESPIRVFIEVNVGQNRCGVEPASPELLDLANTIATSPHLTLAGLHCYQGALQHVRTHTDRAAQVAQVADAARRSRDAVEKAGHKVEVVTGGGTGTFLLEAEAGVHNECQPGSYLFMDLDYGRNLGADGQPVTTFVQSLYIEATVMSKPNPNRAVVDAGLKVRVKKSVDPAVQPVAVLQQCHRSGVVLVHPKWAAGLVRLVGRLVLCDGA
eukprot:m.66558 g.66558  ORF g.66558 m.66558 type:complete len:350 (-) comp13760_c0_seq2:627-1676(-)